ncbi:hypothetical protein MVEN_02398500 [Mycena venus]|uniref:DUF6534 domain-containing protein n=1 Tax=Mycena venus TaxID=2733690 RepID=A0A8H6X2M3_9AGAR|nr:hypothetical protein MVEN_02398500 [Mycena venus]
MHLIPTVLPSTDNLISVFRFGIISSPAMAPRLTYGRFGVFGLFLFKLTDARDFGLASTSPRPQRPTMAPNFRLQSTLGLGVTELGIFATFILFGMLIPQVYIYHLCNSDRTAVKTLVAAVFILEACHTGVTAQAIYYWTVTLADLPDKPGTVLGLSLGLPFETLVTFLVQAYYIYRVHRFAKKRWISVFLFTLCLFRFGGGIALSVESFMNLPHEPDYFSLQNRFGWLLTTILSLSAAVDVFIAASLCVYVHRWKLNTAPTMKTTSQLINRIMFWSIQTGLVTSLVSVTVVVCFQTMKSNYVWFGIFTVLGKLYSNSLLASLNSRSLYRKLDAHTRNLFALFSDDSIEGIGSTSDVEFAGGSTGDCTPPSGRSPDPFNGCSYPDATNLISTNATHSTMSVDTGTTSGNRVDAVELKSIVSC